jgi:hypothetical protein
MATGLYPEIEIVERNVSGAVSATTLFPPFIAPCDLDVYGLAAHLGNPPGGGATYGITINVNVAPTSQATSISPTPAAGQPGLAVSAYNLWTAANVPSIFGTASNNFTVTSSFSVAAQNALVLNLPYALNYPLPGPSGTVGFITAQATSQGTSTPVVTPPQVYKFGIANLVAPDNTYTDFNGITNTASVIHAGDVCSFVIAADPAGSIGSAANLSMSLYLGKR